MRSALGYDTEASRRVVSAKAMIDQRFGDEISLESLSREVLVSKFHLVRRFRDLYGSTPFQYLTDVRLKQSALLLRQGQSVLEVCHGVGFGSPTTFSGLFRKRMGVSPSRYRVQQSVQEKIGG